jgi:hypothetical protein
MDTEAQRNDDVDAYWRRRVVVLGGVLAAVGLVVWSCSGGSDGGRTGGTTVRNVAVMSSPTTLFAPGPAQNVQPARPTPRPTVTITAQVTVVPSPKRRPGDACDTHDIVIDLTPTKTVYGRGEQPQFRLSVVNTGQQACTFGVGPRELQIQVVSGPDKVWNSATCVTGTGSSIQMLRRGIPYAGIVTWDRHRSPSGGACRGRREEARPGTYTVVAKGLGIRTSKRVFVLR